jgi:hypothetical protein
MGLKHGMHRSLAKQSSCGTGKSCPLTLGKHDGRHRPSTPPTEAQLLKRTLPSVSIKNRGMHLSVEFGQLGSSEACVATSVRGTHEPNGQMAAHDGRTSGFSVPAGGAHAIAEVPTSA